MLTEEELASAYNQLDMLVQPEGDAALESLMAHIRELKRMFVEEVYKELAEAYAELTRYQAQAFRGVAYEPTEEVNEEIRRWTGLTDE
jgi:ribosomal protein L29